MQKHPEIGAKILVSGGGRCNVTNEIVMPEELRPALALLLRTALHNPGPHLGAFQIPGVAK